MTGITHVFSPLHFCRLWVPRCVRVCGAGPSRVGHCVWRPHPSSATAHSSHEPLADVRQGDRRPHLAPPARRTVGGDACRDGGKDSSTTLSFGFSCAPRAQTKTTTPVTGCVLRRATANTNKRQEINSTHGARRRQATRDQGETATVQLRPQPPRTPP